MTWHERRNGEHERNVARTRVLAFYRELARKDRPWCEECLRHPSALCSAGKVRASLWAEAEWNGERHNVYACEEHGQSSKGNLTSWRAL